MLASRPSLYALYIKERQDCDIIEHDFGFASYSIIGNDCNIRDVYVIPTERRHGYASKLLNRIEGVARNYGCSTLWATVSPLALGSTEALKAVLGYGFELYMSQDNLITFKKSIGGL